jgi:glycosyltransferase involved in cell wall biosynthesis
MIFRDAGAFIEEALSSVFSQTFQDWELLLVDDGSHDSSSTIARRCAAEQPDQVRYLDHAGHANLGMSASRNLGLRAARGDYIAFLDADDVYLPQRLRRHVEILDCMSDVGMVQSELVHWYSWQPRERREDDDYSRPYLRIEDHLLLPPEGLIISTALPLYSAGICNITVRRDAALRVGGFEDEFRGLYEDQVFLAKLYLSVTTYVLQSCLAKYRRQPDSWVRRAKSSGNLVQGLPHPATEAFHSWLLAYVGSSGIRDPRLASVLRQAREADRRSAPVAAGELRQWVASRTRSMIRGRLPRRISRQLLRWNRVIEYRRARKKYRKLDLPTAGRLTGQVPTESMPSSAAAERAVDVSVIMIFFDAAEFIDEAIRSVLSQTHTSWELILVDDGSTDRSTVIAREHAARNPGRIRYIEHPAHRNLGTGPSRNLGLTAATGHYASFLDADDIYLPERVARHVSILKSHPRVGLAISPDIYWRSWKGNAAASAARADDILGPDAEVGAPIQPPNLLEATLADARAPMPGICSVTFDRSLSLRLGGVPSQFVDQYEDQALIAKLMLATCCVVLDEPLAKYRQHSQSLTRRAEQRGLYRPGRPHQAHFAYLSWLRTYAATTSAVSPSLDAILHRRTWAMRHPLASAGIEQLRTVYRRCRSLGRLRAAQP